MPKVSVILPTYNDLKYLDEAVSSALSQTFEDFELIVVDDGSTDGTSEYLETIKNKKLRVIRKENGGAFDAINHGIEHARGELLTWISSDNICPEYFLEALVAGIESSQEAKFAYASYYNIDQAGNTISVNLSNHQFPNEQLTSSHRGNAAFIYYKDCHDVVGGYINSHACDTDMWIKLVTQFDIKPVYIIEPIYSYRFHNERVTSNLPAGYLSQAMTKMFDEFKNIHGSENILRVLYPNNLSTNDPYNVGMACNDVAIRYANVGLLNHAMAFWQTGLSNSEMRAFRAITHNISETAAKYKIDASNVLQTIKNALAKNNHISDEPEIERFCEEKIQEALKFGFCGYISDQKILQFEYKNKFVCFSYLAWKNSFLSNAVPHSSPA